VREQREELDELRAGVEELSRSLARSCEASLKAVLRLREEREGAEQREGRLRQSLGDREKVEEALRAKVSAQSAALERQKGQLSLLESRVEGRDSDMHAQRHELAELREQAQEAQRREHEARRELSLAAGARDAPSQAEVVALKSLVEAKEAEVARLQEEMEAEQVSNEARIVGIQTNFQQKVCELRKVHSKQLEAAEKAKQETECALARESQVRQRLEERADGADASRKSLEGLESLQRELEALRRERDEEAEGFSKDIRGLQDSIERLTEEKAHLGRLLQRAREEQADRPAPALAPAPAPLNEAALEMMEQQLVRLSQVIRKKEDELQEVRETVQTMCGERNDMLKELQSLRLRTAQTNQAGGHTPAKSGPGKARRAEPAGPSPSKALALTRKPTYRR